MRKISVVLVLFLHPLLNAALTVYPDTPNAVVSSVYSLHIDGTPVQVRAYMDYHYAHFAFDGTVELSITAPNAIHTYKISPLSLDLKGQVSGNTLTFSMTQSPDTDSTPRYLVIKINDFEELVILGDPLETDAPPSSGPGIFNVVTDFGADNTGATQTQSHIQNAINAAGNYGNSSRKGIVYVPAGLYIIHEDLRLRSYVDLYLAPGAVLKSDPNKNNYNTSNGTIEPALEIRYVQDAVVRGRGQLDASGLALMNPVGGRLTSQSPDTPRRRIIRTRNASNVVIKDIIVKDATGWSVEILLSDNVLVQNVKVLNHRDVWYKIENDGINNVSSDNTTVNQCFVITIDDAYCFKARYPQGGSMDNGVFSNCIAWNSAAGVKCGMQNDHAMNNMVFRNMDIIHCRRAIAFDTKTGSPPVPISGPVFTDIRCEELKGNFSHSSIYAVEFYTETEEVRNITISNFMCMMNAPIRFSGNFPVSNVTFNNLMIGGKPILREADAVVSKAVPVTGLVFKSDPYVNLSGPRSHGTSSFIVTVRFSEDVTGLEAGDFVVTHGTAVNLSGGPRVYHAAIQPSGSETVQISLPGGVVQDNELNGNFPSNILEIPAESPISVPKVASGSLYLYLEANSLGLTDGAAVTSWTDSVNGYEFTGTATYDASYANGHAAVYFNGINNMLVNRALVDAPSTANLTLFVVGNFTTAGNDGVSDFMISGQYPSGSTANRLRILKRHTTGMIDIGVGAGGVSSNIIAADTDRHVYTIVSGQTGNAVKFLIDNTALRTTNSGTGAVALQALGLGAYHNGNEGMGNQFGDCSIAEVLLYDRALTDSDMTIVYNYLREKYFYDIPDAVYQAEDCTAYSDCTISSEHAGATGENNEYVDMGGMNSWFEWDFIDGGTSGGNTALTFRYAVGDSSSRLCEISLNGVFVGMLNFPSTGSWDAWSIAIMDITLMPGLNTIRVTATTSTGGPNVDKMEVGQATVSFEHFAQFAQWWLHTHCHLYGHCGGADLDRDGTVTLKDYAILARQWLKGQVGL